MPMFKMGLGLATKRDPRDLQPGELTVAKNCEYRPGADDSIFPIQGKTAAGSFGSNPHTGLVFAEYQAQADKIIVGSASEVWEATAADSMSPTQAKMELTGDPAAATTNIVLGSSPRFLGSVFQERAYLLTSASVGSGTTYEQNLVRLADGTFLLAGLLRPPDQITASVISGVGTKTRPSVTGSGWQNPSKAVDTDAETFARAKRSTAGSTVQEWTFSGAAGTNRSLYIVIGGDIPAKVVGLGGSGRQSLSAYLKIEVDTASATYVERFRRPFPVGDTEVLQFTLPDTSYAFRVKATLVYDQGSSIVVSRIYDIFHSDASVVAITTDLGGVRYLYTEYNKNTNEESSHSPESALVTLTANFGTVLTIPAKINPATTHFRIYRSTDGAAKGEFDKYGQLAMIPAPADLSTATTYRDIFTIGKDTVGIPSCPILVVGQGAERQFYSINDPPPLARSMCFYKQSAVYVPIADTDNIYWSQPFQPTSCSPLYSMPNRSPKDDRPVGVTASDDIMLLFMQGWTKRIQGLPTVINGQFDATQAADASTTRGAASEKSFDWFTLAMDDGTEWLAVADYKGVYITNGYRFHDWSDEINWNDPEAGTGEVDITAGGIIEVKNNVLKKRIEVYYHQLGQAGTGITHKLFFYYGQMRPDGKPKISGPHTVLARGHASGFVSGAWKHWTGSTTGQVYREYIGTLDASQADGSTAITRLVTTGRVPLSPGQEMLVRAVSLRTPIATPTDAITQTYSLVRSSGEIETVSEVYAGSAPEPVCVLGSGEYLQASFTDTGTGSKLEIIGFIPDMEPLSFDDRGAMQSFTGASAGSSALPT